MAVASRLLILHRNDLRVLDQPAFAYAAQQGLVPVGCFIECEAQWRGHGHGDRKIRLIRLAAEQLRQAYIEAELEFVWLKADDYLQGVERLAQWLEQHPVDTIALQAEYELNEYRRDSLLADIAREKGIELRIWHDQILMNPELLLNGSGQPYKVFTPFSKKWRSMLEGTPAMQPSGKQHEQHAVTPIDNGLEFTAHQRLEAFLQHQINDYHWQRDRYDLEGTSHLSADFSIGLLSLRQGHWAALNLPASEGVEKWRTELIWRSFYKYIAYWFPHVCRGESFRPETDQLQWEHNPAGLIAWQQGRTGFPVVDAAQRCLLETGWMPNRLRMVTAMFLTKDLGLDWRLGEAWFMDQLLDSDFASNNGGWQWSASTGVDAAPYFRIFNPTEQSKKFDPDGNFIRQWVSELTDLSAPDIHNPASEQRVARGYPEAIVNHKQAREITLARFKKI
jgi:deoxyribodipyrimidine photo-lyase